MGTDHLLLGPRLGSLLPRSDDASQCPRHFALEALRSERESTVGRSPDLGQKARIELAREHRSVGGAPAFSRIPERLQARMHGQQRVRHSLRVEAVARPRIVTRVPDHARAYRVGLDVLMAPEQIALAVDQAGAKASLPERPGAMVLAVEVLDITLSQELHRQPDAVVLVRRHQQVRVVGHQHIGVHRHAVGAGLHEQVAQVPPVIGLRQEARGPVVAALNHVKRDACKAQARSTGHGFVPLVVVEEKLRELAGDAKFGVCPQTPAWWSVPK